MFYAFTVGINSNIEWPATEEYYCAIVQARSVDAAYTKVARYVAGIMWDLSESIDDADIYTYGASTEYRINDYCYDCDRVRAECPECDGITRHLILRYIAAYDASDSALTAQGLDAIRVP